jgi:ABC-2 type transport system ATP-binding protein
VRAREPGQREPVAELLSRVLRVEIVRESDPALLSARTDDAERVADALGELARSGIAVASFSIG